METREDITVLTLLNTTGSIKRTMKSEDVDYDRSMRNFDREIMGGESMPDQAEDDTGSLEITGVRSPITINYGAQDKATPDPPIQQQRPATSPGSGEQVAPVKSPPPPAAVDPTWKKWAKRAALVVAGAGLIGGYQWWNKPADEKPPAIEQPAENPGGYIEYGIEVVPGPNRPEE